MQKPNKPIVPKKPIFDQAAPQRLQTVSINLNRCRGKCDKNCRNLSEKEKCPFGCCEAGDCYPSPITIKDLLNAAPSYVDPSKIHIEWWHDSWAEDDGRDGIAVNFKLSDEQFLTATKEYNKALEAFHAEHMPSYNQQLEAYKKAADAYPLALAEYELWEKQETVKKLRKEK